MRKIAKLFFMAIIATILFASRASAVTNPKLSDNPASPQSIEIHRIITGVKEPVTNTFEYEIYETKNSNLVRDIPTDIKLEFDEAEPDEDGVVEQSATIDLSNMSFKGVGGIRYLAIREISSSDDEDYPLSSQIYYFRVAMAGETDAAGWQTGHFTPTLMLPFEDENGEKFEVADFSKAYDDTRIHITLMADGEGETATPGDVIRYTVTVFGREGEIYNIKAPTGEYEIDGELYKSDTECVAGLPCYIYLHPGETAMIGVDEDNNDQIRVRSRRDIEREYFGKYVAPEPVQPKPPKTGIAVRIMPFIILAVMAIIGIVALRATPREK